MQLATAQYFTHKNLLYTERMDSILIEQTYLVMFLIFMLGDIIFSIYTIFII